MFKYIYFGKKDKKVKYLQLTLILSFCFLKQVHVNRIFGFTFILGQTHEKMKMKLPKQNHPNIPWF
jgi:hypothetical protein